MKFNNKNFSNIDQIVNKNEEYESIKGEQGKIFKSRNVLFGSLIWVTIGLIFAIVFTYIQFKFNIVTQIINSISPTAQLVLYGLIIAGVIFIFIGAWFIYSMPVWLVFLYYLAITFIEGIFVGWMTALYAQNWAANNSDFILLLLIPVGTIFFMGFLGYFKVFNFDKIWPLLTLLFITIMITSILVYFISSSWIFTLLAGAGYLFYSLSIGLQIYRIKNMNENYFAVQSLTSVEYLKITLILGTSLLISIFELFRYFLMLLSLFKN